jgi:hypothetical protein
LHFEAPGGQSAEPVSGATSDVLAALQGAAEAATVLLGLDGAAISLAADDGALAVVATSAAAAALASAGAATTRFPLSVDDVLVGALDLFEAPGGPWPADRTAAAAAFAGVVADLLRIGRAARVVVPAGPAMAPPADNVLSSEEQSVLLFETTLLTSQPDEQAILDRFTQLTVPAFGDWGMVFIRQPDGSLPQRAVATSGPEDPADLARERERWLIAADADNPVVEVARTRKPVLLEAVPDEVIARAVTDPAQLELVRAMGVRSALLLPLDGTSECIGVIVFVSTSSGTYTEADLAYGTALAARLTTAIEQARARRG